MNVEKYVNSRLFMFFEWTFKLIIWNLLALAIILIVSGIPLYTFYYIQNENSISEVHIVEDGLEVKLKNEKKTMIDKYAYYGQIEEIDVKTTTISFKVEEIYITMSNEHNLVGIDSMYFDNKDLVIIKGDNTYTYQGFYNHEIDIENSNINSYSELVITLENGVKINYGDKVDNNSTLAGIVFIIALICALFAFIPSFTTIFSMIKIFAEDGSADTFVLFFDRLWDNFKSLYRLEFILIPIIALVSFAIFMYYNIITSSATVNFLFSFAYNILLVFMVGVLLFIINIPLTLGYFRMKTRSIFKFTISMTFKNILFSILYIVLFGLPILGCILNNIFIPFWFLLGLSLPLFIVYHLSAKKYRYIVNNFEKYKEDDIYELKGENDNEIRD